MSGFNGHAEPIFMYIMGCFVLSERSNVELNCLSRQPSPSSPSFHISGDYIPEREVTPISCRVSTDQFWIIHLVQLPDDRAAHVQIILSLPDRRCIVRLGG